MIMTGGLYNYIEHGGEAMRIALYTIWFLTNLILQSYDASELIAMTSGILLIIRLLIFIVEKATPFDVFPGTNSEDDD